MRKSGWEFVDQTMWYLPRAKEANSSEKPIRLVTWWIHFISSLNKLAFCRRPTHQIQYQLKCHLEQATFKKPPLLSWSSLVVRIEVSHEISRNEFNSNCHTINIVWYQLLPLLLNLCASSQCKHRSHQAFSVFDSCGQAEPMDKSRCLYLKFFFRLFPFQANETCF